MLQRIKISSRRLAVLLSWIVLAGATSGCQTAQFYRQAIHGELEILRNRRPISEMAQDPDVSAELKKKFELVTELRAFAQSELKLPVDKDYLTYVDLHRRFAVWNVHAAHAYSLEPKKWWYPFVGSLKYRGYFVEKDALGYARRLKETGDDVYVEGVEAFSTLGWFADPLMNTFIRHPAVDLAETIFHELTHQRLFLSGDTDFNEAFATTLAEEGVRRWLLAAGKDADYARYQFELHRNREFVDLVMRARERLQDLYGDTASTHQLTPGDDAPRWMTEEKERILSDLREGYAQLKASWGGDSGYDGWFSGPLNNAQLNTIAVYYELVPGFRTLLREADGNLERFYALVENMRKLSKDERHRRLRQLAQSVSPRGERE